MTQFFILITVLLPLLDLRLHPHTALSLLSLHPHSLNQLANVLLTHGVTDLSEVHWMVDMLSNIIDTLK
jgi:hypothetical protein